MATLMAVGTRPVQIVHANGQWLTMEDVREVLGAKIEVVKTRKTEKGIEMMLVAALSDFDRQFKRLPHNKNASEWASWIVEGDAVVVTLDEWNRANQSAR